MRDVLDEARVDVERAEVRLESADDAMRSDPLTGLASRAELERSLDAWWEEGACQAKPLCVAMVDLDHLSRVNEQHGQETGNRVIRAVGQLLAAESRHHATAGRYSGQRFLLLFEETSITFIVAVWRLEWIELRQIGRRCDARQPL